MQNQESLQNRSSKSFIIAFISFLIISVLSFFAFKAPKGDDSSVTNSTDMNSPVKNAENPSVPSEVISKTKSPYKDGTYSTTANYVSEGGADKIDVSIQLVDGLITDASVTPQASNSTSERYQTKFAANFKQFVVGKSINNLSIDTVSGASLTTKGFNDALEKLRSQANL